MKKDKNMKNRISKYISFFMVTALISLASCEKSDIDKANEAYDFSKIVPIIKAISGPATAPAHGLSDYPYNYSVPARGGSSFAWSLLDTKYGGTIVVDPVRPYMAKIIYNQSAVDTAAIIRVVETTMGGIVSEPKELNVKLTKFCPYNMDAFVGNLQGTISANASPMIGARTANLNELKITGLAGFIQSSWGENWVVGDGSCILKFSCGETVIVERQKLGETDYPDTYFIEGTGTIDPVNNSITLTFKVFYTGGSTAFYTTTITKL
jgi:hypothetical protein